MPTFHYRAGRYVDHLAVGTNDTEKYPTMEPYRLDIDQESLSMDAATANTLALDLINALYDTGALTMDTAEALVNRGNAVLVDAEPIKCPACLGRGQVGAPWDPESCSTCRGEGTVMARDFMTRDEYDALVADVYTEES